MDLLEHWAESLHLGYALTGLLVLVALIVKKKMCEHDRMYLWYIGKLALDEAERKRKRVDCK